MNNLSLVSSIAKHIHVSSDDKGGSLSTASRGSSGSRATSPFRSWTTMGSRRTRRPTSTTPFASAPTPTRRRPSTSQAGHQRPVPCGEKGLRVHGPPVRGRAEIAGLPDLSDSELRPEFVEALGRLKRLIFAKALPLTVPGQDMVITGPLLADLSQTYVNAINSNKVPVIRDSWSLLSETECARAADGARRRGGVRCKSWGTCGGRKPRPPWTLPGKRFFGSTTQRP